MSRSIQKIDKAQEIPSAYVTLTQNWGYWPYEDLYKAMETGDYVLFSMEEGPGILGSLLVHRSVDFVDVIYIYVDPQHRGKGFGLDLLEACELHFQDAGGKSSLFLEVRKDNLPAQKLYEAFGMQKIHERLGYYPDGCDALVYKKDWKR